MVSPSLPTPWPARCTWLRHHPLTPAIPTQGLDIGPDSVELVTKALDGAKTIIWNGPMGESWGDCGWFPWSWFTHQTVFAMVHLLTSQQTAQRLFSCRMCAPAGVDRESLDCPPPDSRLRPFTSLSQTAFPQPPSPPPHNQGVFEFDKFSHGTFAVANTLATKTDAITIIGGGDSVAAVEKAGVASKMSHISTGGGASLELLEGKVLPGELFGGWGR